jgi:hypothetical protein
MLFLDISQLLLDLDAVEGKNINSIAVNLNKIGKRVMARLPDELKAPANFTQFHKAKIGTSVAEYEPFSLVFGDGQVLTALVKNKNKVKTKKPNLNRALVVEEWFLNRKRVTQYIYKKEGRTGQNRGVSDAETAKNIAELIIKTHERFVKGKHLDNPVSLKKQIRAIVIDTSRTVEPDIDLKPILKKIVNFLNGNYTVKEFEGIRGDIEIIEENEERAKDIALYHEAIALLEAI